MEWPSHGMVAVWPPVEVRPRPGAGARGEVTIWDVSERTTIARFAGHPRAVMALAFSPDGTTLATSGLDATVRLWDVATGQSRLVLGGLPCSAQCWPSLLTAACWPWGGAATRLWHCTTRQPAPR